MTSFNRDSFEIVLALQRKYHYAVLHGVFLYPAGFIAVMAAGFIGIRSIVSIRGNDVGRNIFDPLLHSMIQPTLERADFVTSVATSLLKVASDAAPSIRKSRVILNSVAPHVPNGGGDPFSHLSNRPVLGSAGIFRYKKGIVYLLRALADLRESHTFSLVLAGGFSGPVQEQLHTALLEKLQLTDRTYITGLLPREILREHLSWFDVLVFPSLFSEGCPLTMLEAMSAGTAVVGSRSGAIPEVIADERSGLLFDPGDTRMLKSHIQRLIENGDLRRSLGEEARLRAEQLSPEREEDAWRDTYREVVGLI
jgi:glycosyltransferase involved in cell wall biosynthesis